MKIVLQLFKILKEIEVCLPIFFSVGRCFRFFKLGVGLGCLGVVLFFCFICDNTFQWSISVQFFI